MWLISKETTKNHSKWTFHKNHEIRSIILPYSNQNILLGSLKTDETQQSHAGSLNIDIYLMAVSYMFGFSISSTQTYILFLSWPSLHFLIDAVKSWVENVSITHFKFVERRPCDNKILYMKMDRVAIFKIILRRYKLHFGKKKNYPFSYNL